MPYLIVSEFEALDTGETRPGELDVRGPVDPVAVRAGAGEAKSGVKELLDGRSSLS
jgi:hypothetical protein